MSKVLLPILIVVAFLCSGCPDQEFQGFTGQGKRPIYISFEELNSIANLDPQTIGETGPIFLLDDWFFMVEQGQGIHVFDIEDSQQETALTFIKIPAIVDFTIDGTTLYSASWTDLVAIDISDIFNVKLLSRTEGVIDPFLYPPLYTGPFECIDLERGAVTGWSDEFVDGVLCDSF